MEGAARVPSGTSFIWFSLFWFLFFSSPTIKNPLLPDFITILSLNYSLLLLLLWLCLLPLLVPELLPPFYVKRVLNMNRVPKNSSTQAKSASKSFVNYFSLQCSLVFTTQLIINFISIMDGWLAGLKRRALACFERERKGGLLQN